LHLDLCEPSSQFLYRDIILTENINQSIYEAPCFREY
jgi:hypothetical protein